MRRQVCARRSVRPGGSTLYKKSKYSDFHSTVLHGTATVNATVALRNRLDEMESATQIRIEKLSARVAHLESLLSSGDASPEKRPRVDDTPASVYVKQIKALTQDVLKEKRDKERMVSKLETLQTSVRNMKDHTKSSAGSETPC